MMKRKMKKLIALLCAIAIVTTSVTIWNQKAPVKAADSSSTEVTPVYLPGFKNVTFSSFQDASGNQMAEGEYSVTSELYSMKSLQGQSIDSFHKTLLSMKLKFSEGGLDSRIEVLGKDNTSYFMIYPANNGKTLRITSQGSITSAWQERYVRAVDLDSTLTSETATDYFLNKEFTLQISFEYGDFDDDNSGVADDLRLGFYYNGVTCDNMYDGSTGTSTDTSNIIKDCNIAGQFGNCLRVRINGGSIIVHSVIPENDNLTHVTWSDFVATGQTVGKEETTFQQSTSAEYDYILNESTFNDGYDHMGNTSFEVKMTFEGNSISDETRFQYAGTGTWQGIPIRPIVSTTTPANTGNLTIRYLGPTIKPVILSEWVNVSLKQNISGVNCWNNEFTLKITTEFADYDGEGDINDVQLGFYLNGALYNNQYLYAYDVESDFGKHIFIRPYDCNMTIKSVHMVDDVAYDLTGHDYPLGAGNVWVNGELAIENVLTEPGEYKIAVGSQGNIVKNVVAYFQGDANASGAVDVRDLVAALKIENEIDNSQFSKPQLYGADVDKDGMVASEDLGLLRSMLIEDEKKSNAVSFDFIGGKDVMPITGYYGPRAANETLYNLISQAGINTIVYTDRDYSQNASIVEQHLELGEKYGLGIFVNDSYITGKAGASHVSSTKLANQIAKYSKYKSFCGMFLVDEPGTADYQPHATRTVSRHGELARDLQYDLGLTCYMNMYPMYNIENVTEEVRKANYEKYVAEFCETLQPKILMWDNYPFGDTVTLDLYFYNMNLMREYSKKLNIPFWAFIQAGAQWNDEEKTYFKSKTPYYPDQEQFNWNVNTCLAFGVQGIQYFPLTQPEHFAWALDSEENQTMDYDRNGMIGFDGEENQWYGYAKTINTHIEAIDEVLMNSVHEGIIVNAAEEGTTGSFFSESEIHSVHDDIGDVTCVLAKGVDTESQYGILGSSSTNVADTKCDTIINGVQIIGVDGETMIGCFDYNGKTALYIVNYDMESAQTIRVKFDKSYQMKKIANATESDEYTDILEIKDMAAGEGILIVIES